MAIITVLAAVAIPTFSKQLETARETADVEELRNAYTDAYLAALQDVAVDNTLTATDGKFEITGLTLTQSTKGFEYVVGSIGGVALSAITGDTIKGQTKATFTFTYTDGKLACTAIETAA